MAEYYSKNQIRPIARNLKPPPRPRVFADAQSQQEHFEPQIVTLKVPVVPLQSVNKIRISHFEHGPSLFYAQLESTFNELQHLVGKLQKTELHPFRARPIIGMACLARHDNKIYRVAIAKIHQHSSFSVNFVDYGFTATVNASNLFYIPDEFVRQLTFATPFCLATYKANELKVSDKEIGFYFRQLTDKQSLTLKCVGSDGPPLGQYCELFLDDKTNILSKLKNWNPYGDAFRFRAQDKLEMKVPLEVTVSYVDSAQEFYVHLQKHEVLKAYDASCDELFKSMSCSHSPPVYRNPSVGKCCAVFLSGDFYRGIISGMLKNNTWQVKLVDFGITEEIQEKHIYLLTDKFIDIKPFAHRACLKGFESIDVSENISTQFDIFCNTIDGRKVFKMVIVDTFKGTYLVELEDGSVNPPVNVNKMLLKNSRPLIETIQLENAKKRQKDARSSRDGNHQKPANENSESAQQMRDRNSAPRGNNSVKSATRQLPENNSKAEAGKQPISRTHFEKPSRADDERSSMQKEETTWRSRESKESTPGEARNKSVESDQQKKSGNLDLKSKSSKGAKPKVNGSGYKSGWVSTLLTINRAFIHYDEHIEGLEKILDEMFAFYEKSSRPILKDLQIGIDCASRSSDGNWYRSRVESISNNDTVKVFHREYGNSELIHKSKLRKLDEKFLSIGDLVVPTYFAIQPTLECDEKSLFNEMMKKFEDGSKEFHFQVVQNIKSGVILEPIEQQTNKNVIDELVKAKKAQRISLEELTQILDAKPKNEKTKEQPKKERKSPEKAKKVELTKNPQQALPKEKSPSLEKKPSTIKITAVTSPTDFYISRVDSAANFSKLQEDIQIIASGAAALNNFEEGESCLAQQPYDLLWYRSKIIDSDDSVVTVRSLDDGKTFSVDSPKLKIMPAALERKKFFGIACSLAVKVERKCEEEATELIMKLMENELRVEFITDERDDVKKYVELYDQDDKSVTEMMIQRKFARRLETIQPGKGFTSHINSTQSFYLQFEMDQLKLDVISQYFEETKDNFAHVVDPKPGSIVASLFPEDNCWYRTRIESIEENGFLVKFIDYGNLCRVDKIGEIAEAAIVELPAYAKHCSLRKPKGIKAFSEKAEKMFIELCANGATILDIVMTKPGLPTAEIDIFIDGINIADKLTSFCDENENELDHTTESHDSENLVSPNE